MHEKIKKIGLANHPFLQLAEYKGHSSIWHTKVQQAATILFMSDQGAQLRLN